MQHQILLFLNLGGGEIFLILLVVLLMFGGKGVPTMARTLGKSIREFKDAANGIQRDFQNSVHDIHKDVQQHSTVIREEVQEVTKDELPSEKK
jgi:sec-independent protein translocase protein TatA